MFPDQPQFVERVLECLGITQTGLGELLGYPNAYQAGHRLAIGQKALKYPETMLLLEACGWLGDITEGPSVMQAPRELAGVALARLLAGQEILAEELRALQKRLDETLSPTQGSPIQKRHPIQRRDG